MVKYNLVLYLLSPYLFLSIIFDSIKKGGGLRFILQRIGLVPFKKFSSTIWLHAASIGETKLAILLYKKLKSLNPSKSFLITTNTESSSKLVRDLNDVELQHSFLPVDWFYTMNRFAAAVNPKICIIIETEIWPNLLHRCKQNNIQSIIVNARLSKKTTDKNKPNIIKPRLSLAAPTTAITLSKLKVISAIITLYIPCIKEGSFDTLVGDLIFFFFPNKSCLRSFTIQINKAPPIIFIIGKPNKYVAERANIILKINAANTPYIIICFLFFGAKFAAIRPMIMALSAAITISMKIIWKNIMDCSINLTALY